MRRLDIGVEMPKGRILTRLKDVPCIVTYYVVSYFIGPLLLIAAALYIIYLIEVYLT